LKYFTLFVNGGDSKLNSRERVLMALEHEEPDLVPLTDHIYRQKSLEGILGEKGVRINTSEKYIKVHRILGLDLICAFTNALAPVLPPKDLTADEEVDEWGIRHKIVDGMQWYLDGPIKSPEDFKKYEVPDPYIPNRFKSAKGIVRLVKDDLAIAGVIGGPFTTVLLFSGFNNFAKTLYTSPNSILRLVEKITWYQTEIGKTLIDVGIDIIWIADDLGMINGPFLSPTTFRKYIFPCLKDMVVAFKRRGVKILLHSDGQIMPLMDDIVWAGIDGVHPIERKAGMSLELMKAQYGDDLTLIGNVDATILLPHGTAEEIREQVLECLRIGAPGGGFILTSDHSIHEGVKNVNAKIMFEIARKYRRYTTKAK